VYFDEEVIEFHLNWLTDMEIDLDEVTLVEDVWSGGGNLGSSVEIFINGLEVGNMVFAKFKYFPDGSLEELDVKVIDVGIGLERIPWLINGSPTSYCDIFP
jgi:alanyl-tRNA synthetase